MDHVMNNNPSSMGDGAPPNYPRQNEEYNLDPDLLNNTSWQVPNDPYARQDVYAQQSYPQYSTIQQPPYANYGTPQSFPGSSYTSLYAPQYQHSNQVDPFGLPSYEHDHTQMPSTNHSYLGDTNDFSYGVHGIDGTTVSPQALERVIVPHIPAANGLGNQQQQQHQLQHQQQLNSGSEINPPYQNWDHVSEYTGDHSSVPDRGYEPHIPNGEPVAQNIPQNNTATFTPPQPVSIQPVSTQPTRYQSPVPPANQSTLRILQSALPPATDEQSARLHKLTPFLVRGALPITLSTSGNLKVPLYKPRTSRSGKPILPGFDMSALSTASISALVTKKPKVRSIAGSVKGPKPPRSRDTKVLPSLHGKVTKSLISSASSPSPSLVSTSSEEESESEDSSEYDEDDDMTQYRLKELESSFPKDRPTDIAAAATWDTVQILYGVNRQATREEIVKATPLFQSLIIKLREDLKQLGADINKAETEKRIEDAKKLEASRATGRKALTNALQAAINYGHRDILPHLGASQRLVNNLTTTLIDSIKAGDFNGELPKAVLELMSKFDYVTDELLQKCKFDSIQKRFNKNGEDEVKKFIKEIVANTVESRAKANEANMKQEAADVAGRSEPKERASPLKSENAPRSVPTSSAPSLKRPLEADNNNNKPNKKAALDTTGVPSQKSAATKTVSAAQRPTSSLFAQFSRGPKAAPPAPKVVTKTPVKAPEIKKPSSPPPSSLAAILASIEKPKEVPKAPDAPKRPPETPEAKAKRERKESRRHLRVRWREDSELEQIKLFKHEQAEDEGRQDNMLRDAHDDRSEGMMLKKRIVVDEEDEPAGEVEYRVYPELTNIDFSDIGYEHLDKNLVTRGGRVTFRTEQQDIQDHRESLELMVVYTDPKDIPNSAKEPPYEPADLTQPEKLFGQPTKPWLVQRLKEIRQYGPIHAAALFARRNNDERLLLSAHHQDTSSGNGSQSATWSSNTDITSILNAMKKIHSSPTTQTADAIHSENLHSSVYQQPTSQPKISPYETFLQQHPQQTMVVPSPNGVNMDPAILANLESIAASLKGKPYPPTQPPDWMTDAGKAMWWEGYNRDRLDTEKKATDQKIAQEQSQVQAPQIQMSTSHISTTPQMQYPQVPGFQIPPATAVSNAETPAYDPAQLQSVLAGLMNPTQGYTNQQQQAQAQALAYATQVQQQQAQALAYASQTQQPQAQSTTNQPQQQQDWANWLNSYDINNNGAQAYLQNQNQQPRWDANQQNQRQAHDGEDARQAYNNQENKRSWDENKRNRGDPSDYKRGTKACKFWQEGKCAKGANCTFRHD